MKKLLLIFICALASVGSRAGTSEGVYNSSDNTLIITITGDPGLENFTGTVYGTDYGTGLIDWVNSGGTIFIKGTPLNSAGINVIATKLNSGKTIILDITESSIEGDLETIPSQFSKILFAPGTALPAASVLSTGTNLKYAYSADDENVDGVEISLYAGTVTSLNEITELSTDDLGSSVIVNLTGDSNGNIKKALIEAGVSEENIKTPAVVDKNTCSVTGGSVEADVKTYALENGIGEDDITGTPIKRILVTGGTLTQADIDYIATLNVEIVNMAAVAYADGLVWKFPTSVEQIVMPAGDAISHTDLASLEGCVNLKYAVNGDFTRIYLQNSGTAGFFTTDLLAEVPADVITTVQGVAVMGSINVSDFDNIQNTFKNAVMFNLHGAELVDGELDDFGDKITGLRNGAYVDFIAPQGTTADNLKALSGCAYIGCSYSVLEDGTFNIYIKDGDRHNLNIAKYESASTTKAVFVSSAVNTSYGSAYVNEDVISALNDTRYIVSVDFSQLPIVKEDESGNPEYNKDDVLSGLTSPTCGIKYVRLPDTCPITETVYEGTTIEIVSRLTSETVSDFKTGNTVAMSVAEVYSNKAGGLAGAAGFKNAAVNGADMMRVLGTISGDDIAGLATDNKYLDFTRVSAPDDFSGLTGGNVEYAALPEGVAIPDGIAVSKGVGTFSRETGTFTFVSKEAGSVFNVLLMMKSLVTAECQIKNIVMSGPLNAFDITIHPSNLSLRKDNLHFAVSVEDGVETLSGGALLGAGTGTVALESADFENAVFYENIDKENGTEESDMVFSAAGAFANVRSLKIPVSEQQTLIPDNCFNNLQSIEELCISENYEVIGEKALYIGGTALKKVTTTSAAGEITDHGDNTVTLSANLKEIRNQAFGGASNMTDVYVLATTAPKCASGAFDPASTYGNNGFKGDASHPIQRSNYKNGEKLIAMLHYPKACLENGENYNYTDPTRVYTLADETGATDAYGNTIMWPKHAEFWRSFQQATTPTTSDGTKGYTWKAWAQTDGTEGGSLIMTWTAAQAHAVDESCSYSLDYQGWHEFVLADNYNVIKWDPQEYFKETGFIEQDWYTLCVPYDLTKSQLLQSLGVKAGNNVKALDSEDMAAATEDMYPDVRTLTHVSRSVKNGKVTLHLSRNLVEEPASVVIPENGQGYEYETLTGDDPVIIKGGYPYLVRPYIPDNDKIVSVGKYVMAVAEECGYGRENTYKYGGIMLPCKDYKIHALNADESTDDNKVYVYEDEGRTETPCYYHFVGTYGLGVIPLYSYYLGANKTTQEHQFFRCVTENRPWNQYSAIITGRSSLDYKIPEAADEENVTLTLKNDDDLIILGGENTTYAGARLSFFLDEGGETTGIEDIAGPEAVPYAGDRKVYNLNGMCVGSSSTNLPKGVYVKNGRKYVVK